MAIARLIAPFASLSGKVIASGTQAPTGGVVAMPDSNGRTLIRSYVVPANPETLYQTQQRSYLTNISEAIQTLSLDQVAGWKTIADTITQSGRLGLDYKLRWNQLFSQVNSYRLNYGQTIVMDAPAYNSANVPSGISAVDSDDSDPIQTVQVTLAESSPTSGSYVFFEFTRALGSTSRLARDNEFQAIDVPPDNIKPRDTSAPYLYNITSERLNILSTMRIGVRATILSSNFYPVARVYNRNIEVGQFSP